MPANRVDWNGIKQTITAGGYEAAEPFLFILPHAGRHLLLAIAEMLEWRATYSDKSHNYDYADWDTLQEIVAATHAGLMEMEQVNLIVAKLEEIRYELEQLRLLQEGEQLEDDLAGMAETLGQIAILLGV